MLKKWLKAWRSPKNKEGGDKVQAARHPVALDIRNHAVLKVLSGLHRAGFEAYLVGGAVRDLLLGRGHQCPSGTGTQRVQAQPDYRAAFPDCACDGGCGND